jgi:hypothetical protein
VTSRLGTGNWLTFFNSEQAIVLGSANKNLIFLPLWKVEFCLDFASL